MGIRAGINVPSFISGLPSGRYALLWADFHRLDRTSLRLAHDAVGTLITERPPHKAVQAAFPHTASTLGV
jgi:hypothetical protein